MKYHQDLAFEVKMYKITKLPVFPENPSEAPTPGGMLPLIFLGGSVPLGQNRTKIKPNSIERLVFDWVRQSNKIEHLFAVSSIFETVEQNRTAL